MYVAPGLKKNKMDNLGPTVPLIVKKKSAIFTAQKVALVFDRLILFSNTFFTNI